MSLYHDIITEATGETEETKLSKIENVMHYDILRCPLDSQTKAQLHDAAQLAVEVLEDWPR